MRNWSCALAGALLLFGAAAPSSAATAHHGGQILYVLVNRGNVGSYVALYHAYASDRAPFRLITDGVVNPGAIWVDEAGNLYVGNDLATGSSVTVYAPGTSKVMRAYTDGIDLPFAGIVNAGGTTYVSDGGLTGHAEGAVAVFPPGTSEPSKFLTDNVRVPHGLAFDRHGNLFLAQIYGTSSSVLEFRRGSSNSSILPLTLPAQAFLEDLKLDPSGDIVVADAYLDAVRFFAPPYGQQSGVLTAGLSAPTALAYGPDGSLFVGNEYVNSANGNVVVFPPGATQPARTIATGIHGGVIGVALGQERGR